MNLRASLAGMPILQKYDLLEEIGHGGMATVYRAKDKRLGREVAVKIIHKHLRENTEVATRFVAEARAAAKLRHPNIVEVYDVSAEEDRYRYLVVELIRGTTLRKVLQEHRDMPAEIGAAIVLELCDALTHAHEAGIIHRDVKPENVLIELPAGCKGSQLSAAPPPHAGARSSDPPRGSDIPPPVESGDGVRSSDRSGAQPRRSQRSRDRVVIKLTDFGIAKMLDAQGVTATGQVLGSPAHMAPEQIEGGEVDARTDVFALGVLMYEALVGHLPFEGKNPAQVLRKVLDGKVTPPEVERTDVGARWSKIVLGALAKDLDQRTPNAAALGDQIRAELSALGLTEPELELYAYFRDPDRFPAALRERIVPALLTRGEAARKQGDSPSAAADFNRALALRPNDMAILKRITSLSASRNRRALLRRAGMISATSLALGLTTFGVVRFAREKAAAGDPPAPAPEVTAEAPLPDDTFDPELDAPPDPSAPPGPTGKPRDRVYTPPNVTAVSASASGAASAPPAGGPTTRKVRFNVVPSGGTLYVDGVARDWFAAPIELTFGPHPVRVVVPDSDCCDEYANTITITRPRPDAPDDVDRFTLRALIRPATVRLVGAPASAQLVCLPIGLSVMAGKSATVKLADIKWEGNCEFRSPQPDVPAKRSRVVLRPGRTNDVPWQG